MTPAELRALVPIRCRCLFPRCDKERERLTAALPLLIDVAEAAKAVRRRAHTIGPKEEMDLDRALTALEELR